MQTNNVQPSVASRKEVIPTETRMEIKNVNGHYEVYDNGKFLFSVDNKAELEEELAEMQKGN